MRLEGVELRQVDLALRRPLGTSAGTHGRRPVVLVRVACEGVDGWGECGALVDGTVVDPTIDEVWRALAGVAVDRLLQAARARGGALPPASEVARCLDAAPADRMAAAALEMAVLDAELQAAGVSLASSLGTAGGPVAAGGVVGIPADRKVRSLLATVADQVDQGAQRVRLKIEPGWDVGPVRAVRQVYPDLALQADGNGAYRLGAAGVAAAERLVALDPFGLACIEQPLPPAPAAALALAPTATATPAPAAATALALAPAPTAAPAPAPAPTAAPVPATAAPTAGSAPTALPAVVADDLASHAALAELLATPICLDESLTTLRRLADAIRCGACEVACIKPARLGGIAAARQAQDACRAAGIPAFVGGFFETGLGRSANAALAGLPGFTLAGDLSDPGEYLQVSPCGYDGPEDGLVWPPGSPGVGPSPDPDVLAARTTATAWFPCRP